MTDKAEDKKERVEEEGWISRLISSRRGRIGLLGAGALALVLYNQYSANDEVQPEPVEQKLDLKNKKKEYQGPPKELFSSPRLEGQEVGYTEWANQIVIPRVEIGSSLELSEAELVEMLIPNEIDKTKLPSHYEYFDQVIAATEEGLRKAQNPTEKLETAKMFIFSLMKAYADDFEGGQFGKLREGTKILDINLSEYIGKINRVIIPHGFYIVHDQYNDNGFNFELHEVVDIRNIDLAIGSEAGSILAFIVDKRMDVASDELGKKRVSDAALYEPDGRYAIIRKDAFGDGNEGDTSALTGKANALIEHEGAHAALDILAGMHTVDNILIGPHGTIHMGSYQLTENDYMYHTQLELHELIGLGAELRHLEGEELMEKIRMVMASAQLEYGPAYDFAAFVILYELAYCLDSDGYNRFLATFFETGVNVKDVVESTPKDKLKAIGPRIERLGMRLTEKE